MDQVLDAAEQGHILFTVQALALFGADGRKLGKLPFPEAEYMGF